MIIHRDFEKDEWLKEITPGEFKDSGLLFYVNTILQPLGAAIVHKTDIQTGKESLAAAITKCRGFGAETIDEGSFKLSQYLLQSMWSIIDENYETREGEKDNGQEKNRTEEI